MNTLIAALALASIVAAPAETERSRAVHFEPNNSVICGDVLLDPTPEFVRRVCATVPTTKAATDRQGTRVQSSGHSLED
jgi:hypothetical protein